MATFTVTEQAATGPGSLAAAIAAAEASAGPDRIVFAPSVTRIVTSTTLTINSNIVIDADRNNDGLADVTMSSDIDTDGVGNHTLFVLGTGANVMFDGLIFTKGRGTGGTTDIVAGAILNNGAVTIRNSQFLDNEAVGLLGQNGSAGTSSSLNGGTGTAGGGAAGAIVNRGTMTIQKTLFADNSGIGGNGGSGGDGGTSYILIGGSYVPINGGGGGDAANGGLGVGAILNLNAATLTLLGGVVFRDNIGSAGNGGAGGDASPYGLMAPGGIGGAGADGSATILDYGVMSGTATVTRGAFGGGAGGAYGSGDFGDSDDPLPAAGPGGYGNVSPVRIGTSGNDSRHGLAFSEVFAGQGGNDTFRASAGNDWFFGGNGIDAIDLSVLTAAVSFNLSLNTLQSIGVGRLGVRDVENVIGGSGHDRLTGNALANRLEGGAGNDTLNGGLGADTLIGGLGNDIYHVDTSDTIVETSGQGSDRLIFGGGGTFTLAAGVSIERMDILAQAGAANLTGNELAQTLRGNADNNILSGGGGADRMLGLGGSDTYYVNDARDQVIEAANGGYDSVNASVSFALGAVQEVEMLQTNDRNATALINLTGSNTAQTIHGNNGANVIRGRGGDDYIRAWDGNDTVYGGAGNDTLEGWSGNDRLIGDAGNDVFYGNTGNDTILGGAGNDVIFGGEDNDVLDGGAGRDTLYGGSGNDAFVFSAALGGTNIDVIKDFANAVGDNDVIRLDNAIFTELGRGWLAAANFRVGAGAADANDYIIYNSATGGLFYDADGNGSGAAVRFATVENKAALSVTDFLVI